MMKSVMRSVRARNGDGSMAALAVALAAALGCGGDGPTAGVPNAGGAGGAGRGGAGGGPPGTGGGQNVGGGTGGEAGGAPGAGGGGGNPGDGAAADMAADSPVEARGPSAITDCKSLLAGGGPMSQWVTPDGNGGLLYKALPGGGDHIADFSHAGYRGGGVPLPVAPVIERVAPGGGDDTPAIQAALDAVAARSLASGLRGAVLLAPGAFNLAGVLRLTASGVVLRGSGSGAGGTELRFTGAARRVMYMQGAGARALDSESATITDDNVPAGSRTFTVDRPQLFKVGDEVMVGRPVTAAWIALIGMDKLVRNGAAQTWITPGTVLRAERVVTAVEGNKITVDVPYFDSFDARYVKPPGGSIVKYSFPGRIANVGLESFRAVGSPRAAGNDFHFVEMASLVDGWIKDVVAHDFTSGAVIRDSVTRVTLEDMLVSHTPVEYFTAAAPSDFNIDGSQIFMHRGGSKGGNKIFYHSTAGGVMGPNVMLGFVGSGMRSHVQPHQRWATGLLVDDTHLDDGNIEYMNRGNLGSGHGWTMGWGVIWNSSASTIRAEQPPGVANWAIGNRGTQTGNGTFDSHGTPVLPRSLYLAQLCARLGPAALANLGYR
jgi:hypothetical protein